MKKQLFLAATFLFLITGIIGCKKEDQNSKPLKEKMVGRWSISKMETTIEGSNPITIVGTASDYIDFKEGEDDIVEINVGERHEFGTYSVFTGGEFNISIDNKLYLGTDAKFDGVKFEFKLTESGSNPKRVQKVYLTR